MNITLKQAEQLDDILNRFHADSLITTINAESTEQFYRIDALLDILQRDGYIKKMGGMGTKKMIMILPPGRVFIENGGYVKEINRRLEQESLIKSNKPSKLNQKTKIIYILIMIALGVYFVLSMDSSKNLWDNIHSYISIGGEMVTLMLFFTNKTTR